MRFVTHANFTLVYWAMVLLLGGASAAGLLANLLLQLTGAVLIAWTLARHPAPEPLDPGLRRFAIATAVLMAVQFLPMPSGLWKLLPGREAVYNGLVMIGVDPPWLTLSLDPWESLYSFVWWIPALAIFLAMRAEHAPAVRQLVWTAGGVAVLSVLIGTMQRLTGNGYIYEITNFGQGPGFFANSNHQGSFLLCTLALWAGWMASWRTARTKRAMPSRTDIVVASGIALLLVFGVLVSGSLACISLLVPVLGSLALIAKPEFTVRPAAAAGILAVAGLAFVGFVLFGPFANDLTAKGAVEGISRREFLITGLRIAADFTPFGGGAGTFVNIYPWYENPAVVTELMVNHAHNDLLELLIDTGIFGLVALALFLVWFARRALHLWIAERGHGIALAASMVIGIELVHSLVDYPLRTAAMSAMVALACVLITRKADVPPPRSSERAQPKPAALIRI